jgi:hypothetical protein
MQRRQFITLIGGAAAWPITVLAQQSAKVPTIGFLGANTSSVQHQWTAAFVQRLRELGWIEGRTIAIEYRWAEGRSERTAELAAELVRLNVDVIVTSGTATVVAVKQATSAIPIVFASVGDPVGTGLIASLARPGGNVTGLSNQTNDLGSKRLELLREVVPDLRRLAIMANAGNPAAVLEMAEVQAAARSLGLEVATLRNPASRRYRTRLSGAQGPRGRTLCRFRAAREHQPSSHQHLGAGGATADGVRFSGVRRRWRPDVLWSKLAGPVPARRRVCGQNSARGKAGRSTGRAADQVRSGDQSYDGKGARPDGADDATRSHRRSDRIIA